MTTHPPADLPQGDQATALTDVTTASAPEPPTTGRATRASTRLRNKSAKALENESNEYRSSAPSKRKAEAEAQPATNSAVDSNGAPNSNENANATLINPEEATDAGDNNGSKVGDNGSAEAKSGTKSKSPADVDTGADTEAKADDTKDNDKDDKTVQPSSGPATRSSKRKVDAKPKGKKSKYCTCHEDKRNEPMIECGECSNWFHFKCLGLTEEEADRINNYVCADCEQRTGNKTTLKDTKEPSPADQPSASTQSDPVTTQDATVPAKRSRRNNSTAQTHDQADPVDDKTEVKSAVKPDVKSAARPEVKPAVQPVVKPDAKPEVKKATEEEPKRRSSRVGAGNQSAARSRSQTPQTSRAKSQTPLAAGGESDSDSDSGVAASSRRPAKRARRPSVKPSPRKASPTKRGSVSGGPSAPSSASASAGAQTATVEPLPKIRVHVRAKLAITFQKFFGEDKMDTAAAQSYAEQVETTLHTMLKETQRYKSQFSLLERAILEDIRPELQQSIRDGTLPPEKVALLTTTDLATMHHLEEIAKAQEESLRQTVKKDELNIDTVRIGRDGFEMNINRRHAEMEEIEREEERQRRRDSGVDVDTDLSARRESRAQTPPPSTSTIPVVPSPSESRPSLPPLSPVRRGSITAPLMSPTAPSGPRLSSAWGGRSPVIEEPDQEMEQDQDQIDLSDIITTGVDYDDDDLDDDISMAIESEPVPEAKTPMQEFLAKPVGWSGTMVNPAKETAYVPPIQLRSASRRGPSQPPSYWQRLLPDSIITITGRVPTSNSIQFLSDRHLDRTRDLVAVAFTIDPSASVQQKEVWDELVEFHVAKDRHGVSHPYGVKATSVPPGTAREVYLVPLRPGDATPDVLRLIDGYDLPNDRAESVIVGVFVVVRDGGSGPTSAEQSPSESKWQPSRPMRPMPGPYGHGGPPTGPARPAVGPVAPVSSVPPPPSAPVVAPGPAAPAPNFEFNKLLATLDPAAIANVMNTSAQSAPPAQPAYAPPPQPAAGSTYRPPSDTYNPVDPYKYPPPPPGYAAGPSAPSTGHGYVPHGSGGYVPPSGPNSARNYPAGGPGGGYGYQQQTGYGSGPYTRPAPADDRAPRSQWGDNGYNGPNNAPGAQGYGANPGPGQGGRFGARPPHAPQQPFGGRGGGPRGGRPWVSPRGRGRR